MATVASCWLKAGSNVDRKAITEAAQVYRESRGRDELESVIEAVQDEIRDLELRQKALVGQVVDAFHAAQPERAAEILAARAAAPTAPKSDPTVDVAAVVQNMVLSERQRRAGDVLVDVPTAAADAAFARDDGFYVGPQGTGGIGTRYADFKTFLQQGVPVEAPEVALLTNPDGSIRMRFGNGRHRFAVLRDLDAPTIKVAVHKDDVEAFRAAFGIAAEPPAAKQSVEKPGLAKMQAAKAGVEKVKLEQLLSDARGELKRLDHKIELAASARRSNKSNAAKYTQTRAAQEELSRLRAEERAKRQGQLDKLNTKIAAYEKQLGTAQEEGVIAPAAATAPAAAPAASSDLPKPFVMDKAGEKKRGDVLVRATFKDAPKLLQDVIRDAYNKMAGIDKKPGELSSMYGNAVLGNHPRAADVMAAAKRVITGKSKQDGVTATEAKDGNKYTMKTPWGTFITERNGGFDKRVRLTYELPEIEEQRDPRDRADDAWADSGPVDANDVATAMRATGMPGKKSNALDDLELALVYAISPKSRYGATAEESREFQLARTAKAAADAELVDAQFEKDLAAQGKGMLDAFLANIQKYADHPVRVQRIIAKYRAIGGPQARQAHAMMDDLDALWRLGRFKDTAERLRTETASATAFRRAYPADMAGMSDQKRAEHAAKLAAQKPGYRQLGANRAADVLQLLGYRSDGKYAAPKRKGPKTSDGKPEPTMPPSGEDLLGDNEAREDAAPAYHVRRHAADVISTRNPSGVNRTEDPLKSMLTIGLEPMLRDEEGFAHTAGLLQRYPGYLKAPGITKAEDVARHFIEQVVDNLVWLYNQVPEEIRRRSKLWYDGAHRMAVETAAYYGHPVRAIAGVFAALSPQKDWFMNISLGMRVIEIHDKHKNFRWDRDMERTGRRIFGKQTYRLDLRAIRGKTFAEITGEDADEVLLRKAMWLRTYDEAFYSRDYRIVSPEGNAMGFVVRTGKGKSQGKPSKVAWGSLPTIMKAIAILENPSRENISAQLGLQHKIRSFYNNIVDPANEDGHVTIDTHAVAAALLRGLSGNSLEVKHNFGGSDVEDDYAGPTNSVLTGTKGTYGIYAEAYRIAAEQVSKQLGERVLPRELQSVTWEAVRGLFTDTFKSDNVKVRRVDQIWRDYVKGGMNLDEARSRILAAAGGINDPFWFERSAVADHAAPGYRADQGELPRDGVPGRGAEPAGRGGGVDAAGRADGLDRELREAEAAGYTPDPDLSDGRGVASPRAQRAAGAPAVGPDFFPSPDRRPLVVLRKTGAVLRSGVTRVTTADDAAHVFAGLRKSPREVFSVLMTDANNRPVGAAHMFRGTIAATPAYPTEISRLVYATPGAKKIWLAHNHPSGAARPSRADEQLTETIAKGFGADLGIELKGHIIVAGNQYVVLNNDGWQIKPPAAITPHARVHEIPIVDRVVMRANQDQPGLFSPAEVVPYLHQHLPGDQTGIVWLNSQNQPVAVDRMSAEGMAKLRGTGNYAALMRRLSETNASAAFLKVSRGLQGQTAVENFSAAMRLGSQDVKVLDAFMPGKGGTLESLAEQGSQLFHMTNTVYSLAEPGPGLTAQAIDKALTPLRRKWRNAPRIRVVQSVDQVPFPVLSLRARGVYNSGVVYLIADNIKTMADAQFVLLHEVMGHAGLRGVFGDELRGIMLELYNRNPELRALADAQIENAAKHGLTYGRALAVEEALANLAGEGKGQQLNGWKMFVAAVRNALRKLGFDLAINDADVELLLAKAHQFIVQRRSPARAAAGAPAYAQERNPIFYSALAQAIAKHPQAAATGAHWTGIVDRLPGVKKDEIEWTGVKEWLALQDGKVTREQLQDYLRNNGVQVSETLLGNPDFPPPGWTVTQADTGRWTVRGHTVEAHAESRVAAIMAAQEKLSRIAHNLRNNGYTQRGNDLFARAEELGVYMESMEGLGGSGTTLAEQADALTEQLTQMGYTTDHEHDGVLISITNTATGAEFYWDEEDSDWVSSEHDANDAPKPWPKLPPAVAELATQLGQVHDRLANDGDPVKGAAKYEHHRTPGGKNYRELLITLPTKPKLKQELKDWAATRFHEIYGADYDGWNVTAVTATGQIFRSEIPLDQAATEAEAIADAKRVAANHPMTDTVALPPAKYVSSLALHGVPEPGWVYGEVDQANAPYIIDREGQFVVPVPGSEDIYPDRAAAEAALAAFLASEGWTPNPEPAQFRSSHWDQPNILAHVRFDEHTDADGKRVLMVQEIQSDWAQRGRRDGFATADVRKNTDGSWSLFRHDRAVATFPTEFMARDARNSFPGVPAAPFVQKTEAWTALAMKRIVRYAAENGFDKVAWTTGAQQADRYDLSRQVHHIDYNVNDDGTWELHIEPVDGPTISREVPTRDGLDDLVGKEIAEKIVMGEGEDRSDGSKRLANVDLKVGGEGMRGYYDKIVPTVANNVLKQLGGGRVGEVQIEGQRKSNQSNWKLTTDPATGQHTINFADGESIGPFVTIRSAEEAAKARRNTSSVLMAQPGFDITPEMRAKAMEGQPLFSNQPHLSPWRSESDGEASGRTHYAVRDNSDKPAGVERRDFKTAKLAREFVDQQRRGTDQQLSLADLAAPGELTARATTYVGDLFRSLNTFNPILKYVQTQYHKAQKNPYFRAVFEATQHYIQDVSRFANDAADLAPLLLPRLKSLRDVLPEALGGERTASAADTLAAGRALFAATLGDVRPDEAELRAGLTVEVEGPTGTRAIHVPPLTDAQLEVYNQARATIDLSLDQMTVSELTKLARGENVDHAIRAAIADPANGAGYIIDAIREQARLHRVTQPNELARLQNLAAQMADFAQETEVLKAKGYAPLMRFGTYTVDVTEQDGGEPVRRYFGMFESKPAAFAMEREMRTLYPGATVQVGTMDPEQWQLYQGLSLDSLAAFARTTGLDRGELFQEFYKVAVSSRSAIKRLIHRKGIEGYDEDLTRVLASFVTSNARLSSKNIHFAEMTHAATRIPKNLGDVQEEARKLVQYVQNPTEEAQALRGLLFVNFIGGSIASALTNATQPFMMTLPYLSQFSNPAKAAASLAAAIAQRRENADPQLAAALDRAEKQGITDPQELHQLYAESIRTLGTSRPVRKALRIWGAPFAAAEAFNRRLTFTAAFQMAQDPADLAEINARRVEANQGIFLTAFDFAEQAVEDTQGIYNRGNRPNIGRGALGATVFTFKQYSIAYIEFLSRLPAREKAVALALLLLAAGLQGAPGADNLEDLVDTIGQALGFNTNSRKALREGAVKLLGEHLGALLTHGISGIPGVPIDVQGRMGINNLIPGTALFKRSETDKTAQLAEFLGPTGALYTGGARAFDAILAGNYGRAAQSVAPVAIANAMKGVDMWTSGEYRDQKGRKVIDVDGVDAVAKGIGFQPQNVAEASRKAQDVRQDLSMVRTVEAGIADQWARGIVDGEPETVKAAVEQLRSWNASNPDSIIRITPAQIQKRVKEAQTSRSVRLAKTAPREERAGVIQSLQ